MKWRLKMSLEAETSIFKVGENTWAVRIPPEVRTDSQFPFDITDGEVSKVIMKIDKDKKRLIIEKI